MSAITDLIFSALGVDRTTWVAASRNLEWLSLKSLLSEQLYSKQAVNFLWFPLFLAQLPAVLQAFLSCRSSLRMDGEICSCSQLLDYDSESE